MDGWREGGRDGGMMLMMMGLKVHDGCDDVVADDDSTPSCWRRSVCRCDVQPSCKEEPHGKTHLQSRAPQASEARRPCWNQFPKFECIHAPATPKPDSQHPAALTRRLGHINPEPRHSSPDADGLGSKSSKKGCCTRWARVWSYWGFCVDDLGLKV